MAYHGLKISENEGRLLVSFEPAAGCPQLDVETLRSLLGQAGYDGWFFLDEALATACSSCSEDLYFILRESASFVINNPFKI